MKTLVLLALLFHLVAQAQVRKCEKDGKVVYSDVLCKDTTARETMVDTSMNTLDHSALRKQVAKDRADAVQAAKQQQIATAKPPSRFARCDAMRSVKPMPTTAEAQARRACMQQVSRDYRRP